MLTDKEKRKLEKQTCPPVKPQPPEGKQEPFMVYKVNGTFDTECIITPDSYIEALRLSYKDHDILFGGTDWYIEYVHGKSIWDSCEIEVTFETSNPAKLCKKFSQDEYDKQMEIYKGKLEKFEESYEYWEPIHQARVKSRKEKEIKELELKLAKLKKS